MSARQPFLPSRPASRGNVSPDTLLFAHSSRLLSSTPKPQPPDPAFAHPTDPPAFKKLNLSNLSKNRPAADSPAQRRRSIDGPQRLRTRPPTRVEALKIAAPRPSPPFFSTNAASPLLSFTTMLTQGAADPCTPPPDHEQPFGQKASPNTLRRFTADMEGDGNEEGHNEEEDRLENKESRAYKRQQRADEERPAKRYKRDQVVAPFPHATTLLADIFGTAADDAHIARYNAAEKRWAECSMEEWVKGADELSAKFAKIMDLVKESMSSKMQLSTSLHARVAARKAALATRAEELAGVQGTLMREGERLQHHDVRGGL